MENVSKAFYTTSTSYRYDTSSSGATKQAWSFMSDLFLENTAKNSLPACNKPQISQSMRCISTRFSSEECPYLKGVSN